MAHRYDHPVAVTRAADGMPASFRWRDVYYPVAEVFDTWHLMDHWCVRSVNPATVTYSLEHGEQDRTYYRVCCRGAAGEQVFDLSHDAVTLTWMLDVAHDERIPATHTAPPVWLSSACWRCKRTIASGPTSFAG
jgi:hypothetical protein